MSPPVILITGATRGIGLAAAKQLALRGARVIIGSRDAKRAKTAAAKVGNDAEALQLDITNQSSVDHAVRTLDQRHRHLDVLINNGAILLDHYESLDQLKPETLRETLETNVIGTLRLTQAMRPLLEAAEHARIINVSSGSGQLAGDPQPWAPAYSISKTALNMVTQQIAASWPDVTVNSMCPGWCRTEMGGSEAPRSPEEGADTMVWLALDAPATLSGKFIKDREITAW